MAGSVTVSGNLQDIVGAALQGNSFVRFKLRNFSGFVPRVNGTAILSEVVRDVYPDSSGNISTTMWGNDTITPLNVTFYTLEFWDNGRIVASGNYILNGSTFNFNTQDQLTPPPGAPSPFVLEVNSVMAQSQKVLNLTAGSNMTITDLGAGLISFASSGGGAGTSFGKQTVAYSSTPVFAPTSQISVLKMTLSGNVTSSTFSAAGIISPAFILMEIVQDGSGGHTFNYPANFFNSGGIGTSANQTTFQLFYWDGTNCYAITPPTVFP